ncbi:MAG: hypothetical protein Q4P66_00700 [Actinomycetaceae bacterium]|nr:hypothetical protein [Actinomycetaceae bacterium]
MALVALQNGLRPVPLFVAQGNIENTQKTFVTTKMPTFEPQGNKGENSLESNTLTDSPHATAVSQQTS